VATIRKREGKRGTTWQAIVRKKDSRPITKSFRLKRDAEDWATSVEDALNKDEFVPTPEGRRRTIRDMLERYRKTELQKKKDSRNYERHLDFWIEQIGSTTISGLTRARVIEIRDEMAEDRAAGTVNRYIATLRHAFNIAVTDWEWASKNPLQRIKLAEPRGRDRHLTDDEIKTLLETTRESDHPHLYAIVLTALTTGARRGEITGLNWKDVDLSTGRAILHRTKNTDKRAIVLVPQVVEALRTIQKVRRIDSDLVFDNPNPAGKRTYGNLESAWRTARDKAGLEDFRFHDLRHTFASRMAMNGKTTREIADALGHKTLEMVKRYSHLTDAHVQTAMEETALRILGDE
jgi:integrase